MKNVALAAEYCRIIGVKRIGLFYRVCNDPSVTVLDGGSIFLISFTPVASSGSRNIKLQTGYCLSVLAGSLTIMNYY